MHGRPARGARRPSRRGRRQGSSVTRSEPPYRPDVETAGELVAHRTRRAEFGMARLEQVLTDQRQIEVVADEPSEAEVDRRVGRDHRRGTLVDVTEERVEGETVGQVEV